MSWMLMLAILTVLGNHDGYKIELRIEGMSDSVCYLANYYGDKTYLADTAYMGKEGHYIFEGDSVLPGGIYIIAGQSNNKYLEFIIDQEQDIQFRASLPDIPGTMKVKNSAENELFYFFMSNNINSRKEIERLQRKRNTSGKQTDSVNYYEERIGISEMQLNEFKDSLCSSNPESFVAVLIKAMKDPGASITENLYETMDSTGAYQYYKDHYWENFDISDDRLLRTPLYHKRLESYFGKVVYQHPDSIIKEADLLIDRARTNKETFKYVVWFLTYKFETSKIMGYDEIFVHLVDNYYATGDAFWADSSVVKSLKKRSEELHHVLIGNKANNLILMDTNQSFKSLYHHHAKYMMVLFYEWDCSHCRKEIEALKKWYHDDNLGLEVFAVCTDTSFVEWKKFIIENELDWINVNGTRSITPDYHVLYDIRMTPTLFLLDEEKKILAKRLKTEQLKTFLENYHELSSKGN